MLPAQLGPLLHIHHAPSPSLDNTIEPGSPAPRTPPPPPEGVNSQPAKRGQSLTGADSKLAIALSVSADTLVFDAERNPDEELRLQLEATQRLTDEDKQLVKRFINGLLLSHEAKRLAA
jgi:hypothetical protein